MAAQEGKNTLLCDKCFASVKRGEEFCPECGAPMAQATEGSDSAIYTELAQANLFRMRGEYKGAEDVLLRILRKFPNNVTANTMLGDIAATQGNFDQAAEWYELALDITPKSTALQDKLANVRDRVSERETVSTAEVLGLPTEKPKHLMVAVIGVAAISVVALAAYFLSQRSSGPDLTTQGPNPNSPVILRGDSDTPKNTPPAIDPNPALTAEDLELQKQLVATSDGDHVLQATFQPPTGSVTISFKFNEGEDQRLIAAHVGMTTFELAKSKFNKELKYVYLVGMKERSRVWEARIDAQDYEKVSKSKSDTWLKDLFKNEWTPESPGHEPGTTTGGATGATSGVDTGGSTTGVDTTTGGDTAGASSTGTTSGSGDTSTSTTSSPAAPTSGTPPPTASGT